MGKLYENPLEPGRIVVHDPDPRADQLPRPDEEEIIDVDFESYNVPDGREQLLSGQVCPATFRWREPHVLARLVLDNLVGKLHVRAVFCSRAC